MKETHGQWRAWSNSAGQCRPRWIEETNKKLKKLSNLEETSKDLAARVEQYDADAKDLEEREGDLSKEQTILDRRGTPCWARIVDSTFVRASSSDLSWRRKSRTSARSWTSVLRQLGEKRRLLDKRLGKSKGAATP